ncbi:MAG: hypothetical protein JNG84_03595 [Archangium sp.]|nr:hypothetical protein [Archangium sp.]
MLAVLDEARAAFTRKDWRLLLTLTAGFQDLSSVFVRAWAQLELGEVDTALAALRAVLTAPEGVSLPPSVPWSLWGLRQRFGPSSLMTWGIHDALLEASWREVAAIDGVPGDDVFGFEGRGFIKDWLNPELAAVMLTLPASRRPPAPWQLGGAGAALSDGAWPGVLAWVRERTAELVPFRGPGAEALEAMRAGRRPVFPPRGVLSAPMEVLRALALNDRSAFVHFGRFLSQLREAPDATAAAAELDALLLVEELRGRIPDEAHERIDAVVFRATPKRVLDVSIVRLVDDVFGAYVRHVVSKDGATKKTAAVRTWVEGSLDDALAAVPPEHFSRAVKALVR